jgi:hypothetical protein
MHRPIPHWQPLGRIGGPVLVDLDETLYLRNSTEDFIDCVWPDLLALMLLRVLEVLKPWHPTGGIDTRDTRRVCAISTFFPRTHRRWRAKVQFFAERYVNQELKAALKAQPRAPMILTIGFKSIVTPLLAAMGFADARLIAARMYSFADRHNGKLRMVTRELGAGTVSSCRSLPTQSTIWKCCGAVPGRYEPSGPGRAIAGHSAASTCQVSISPRSNVGGSATFPAAHSRRISPSGY